MFLAKEVTMFWGFMLLKIWMKMQQKVLFTNTNYTKQKYLWCQKGLENKRREGIWEIERGYDSFLSSWITG